MKIIRTRIQTKVIEPTEDAAVVTLLRNTDINHVAIHYNDGTVEVFHRLPEPE